MEYPVDAISDADKLEYCLIIKKFLKVFYNAFSRWASIGLTQVQYNRFPQVIKNKYPYTAKLSNATWKSFLNEDYEPRENIVMNQLMIKRQLLQDSTRWIVDIGDLI